MTNQPHTLREHLQSTIWSRALTPAEMARVEADCFENFVPRGGFVCRKGEPLENWIGIVEGLVKINNFSPEGKAVTFAGVPTGGWFGEGSLLKDQVRKYDVMALRDTRVARCLAAMFNSHLYPGLEKLVQISQEEIGYLSGASRQRANQALQLLEKEGLLRLDYGGIRVLDLEGLRHFRA